MLALVLYRIASYFVVYSKQPLTERGNYSHWLIKKLKLLKSESERFYNTPHLKRKRPGVKFGHWFAKSVHCHFSSVLDTVCSHPCHQVRKWVLGSILTSEQYITLVAGQDLGCSKLPSILRIKWEEESTKIDWQDLLEQHWHQQLQGTLTFFKYDNPG